MVPSQRTLVLTGDPNLMKVTDPLAPFARVVDTLRCVDVLSGNLEGDFHVPAVAHSGHPRHGWRSVHWR